MSADAFDDAANSLGSQAVWLELARMVYEHGEVWLKSDDCASFFGNFERSVIDAAGLRHCLIGRISQLENWHLSMLEDVGSVPSGALDAFERLLERKRIESWNEFNVFGVLAVDVLKRLPILGNRFDDMGPSDNHTIDEIVARVKAVYETIDFLDEESFITPEMSKQILQDTSIHEVWSAENIVWSIKTLRNPKDGVVREEPLAQKELEKILSEAHDFRKASKERQFFDIVKGVEGRLEVLHRTKREVGGEWVITPPDPGESIADIRARERASRRGFFGAMLGKLGLD